MAKREAADQITREKLEEGRYADESDNEPTIAKALAAVMARRKIIKPRGRVSGPSFGASAKTQFSPATSNGNSDKEAKIKALNTKFIEALTQLNTPGTIVDFTPLAKKYISYYESIGSLGDSDKPNPFGAVKKLEESAHANPFGSVKQLEEPVKPNPFASVAPSSSKPFTFGSSISSDKPEAKSEAKPESKPAFSFNPPSQEKPASQGKPVFSFNAPSQEAKPAFSFNPPAQESKPAFSFNPPPQTSTEKPSFSFGNTDKPAVSFNPKPQEAEKEPVTETKETATEKKVVAESSDSESDSDEEVKIQGPTFTLSAKPTVKKSPFSFGPKPEKKPSSDLDSESEVEIKGPTFTFNKKIDDKVFKLKKEEKEKTEDEKPVAKPVFSFGSSNKPEDKPKPAFSFGKQKEELVKKSEPSFGQSVDKPAFSFGQPSDKPAFSFGQASDKPAFSFGAKPKEDDKSETKSDATEKPAFSFGQPSDKPAFSFGQTSDKPAFNSAKTDGTKEEKPAFSFGQSSDKPAFSFGQSSDKPAFSFGQPSDKPAFSFGQLTDKPAFSLGQLSDKPAFSFGVAPSKEEPEEVPEEETGGNFEPVVKLGDKVEATTGEEDEDVLYEKKTKLMLLDTSNKENPYTLKGLGELKVLKNKNTGKLRIVVRADGGLRVLLNTAINKDISYNTIGNGLLVRVPTVNEEKKIDTFVLRVKTPADGEELLKTINEAKA